MEKVRAAAHFAVHFANRELVKCDVSHTSYAVNRYALDQAMLRLSKAKWFAGKALGTYAGIAPFTNSDSDALVAIAEFEYARSIADAAKKSLEEAGERAHGGDADAKPLGEILAYDGVPIVPSICPVIVLQGSQHSMGYQYAQQAIEIFGSWVFAELSKLEIAGAAKGIVAAWAERMRDQTPEIIDFAQGWADGASEYGIRLSHEQVLSVWTGLKPPERFEGAPLEGSEGFQSAYAGQRKDGSRLAVDSANLVDHCSGACAWGQATADGVLVCGASTDHDCTYQATILAYPEDGHAYIFTPFAVGGHIHTLGETYMTGHPGMNNKGLAYVHHGGSPHCGEPEEDWGYGLRRGATNFHILQRCATAKDALKLELSWEIGDAAGVLANPGGFYADASYGYVLESRKRAADDLRPIIREKTFDRDRAEYDFLYATNNSLSPDAGHCHFPPAGGYDYSLEGGWHTFDQEKCADENWVKAFHRWSTKNSECRNRYLYNMLHDHNGKIDFESMTAIYSTGGSVPEGDFDEIAAAYNAGAQWDCSAAHRGNAFVSIMQPDDGDRGIYRACIGPIDRSVNCRDVSHGYYYYDETNAAWDITLAGDAGEAVRLAYDKACALLKEADEALDKASISASGRDMLALFVDKAQQDIAAYKKECDERPGANGDIVRASAHFGRQIRRATRAQVRARQVINEVSRVRR